MDKIRDQCRLCESNVLEKVIDLEPTPIADAYLKENELPGEQENYPLNLYLCLRCAHLQMLYVVDPRKIFRDYIYETSDSPSLVRHFRSYAEDLVNEFEPSPGELVVEIGSNDGTLLRFFQEKGLRVLGVDPAREIAQRATRKGIKTLPAFFDDDISTEIRDQYGPAKFVVANNVFAHSDQLQHIMKGVKGLLGDRGVFVFEVDYVVDLIKNLRFDSIYHEHLSYHAIKPLKSFFERFDMKFFDVERVPTKGGSFRGYVQGEDGPCEVSTRVGELIGKEEKMGLDEPETYVSFEDEINQRKAEIHRLLRESPFKEGKMAGYGASASVTTLLYHFGLHDHLDFLVDDNPDRQGLFSPGNHLPVYSSQELYDRNVDYVLLLAWRFQDPIISKHHSFIEQGGKFLIPLPEVRIIEEIR